MKSKLEDIIGKAIQNEEDARVFYTDLAKKVKDKQAKEALTFMAGEEKKHKEFLVSYREGKHKSSLQMEDSVDYKVAEHIEKPDIKGDLKSKDVYLIAAHRELNSHNFYNALASCQPAGKVKDMLLTMAKEELKHKEKVEYLYSNTAFQESW